MAAKILVVCFLLSGLLLGCQDPAESTTDGQQIANPASENCIRLGGNLTIRDEAGGQAGYCTLPNGTVCEEWALYRNECP